MTTDNIIPEECAAVTEEPEKKNRFARFRAIKPGILKHINRKFIVICCSVVLLGGAIWLNWLFFADTDADAEADPTADRTVIDFTADQEGTEEESYFAAAQLDRQRARDEAIDVYRTVANSPDAIQEIRDDALNGINRIAAQIEQESNIETLIRSKGFEDCVAVLSDNSANIIVRTDALLPGEIAQIKEIVVEQAGVPVSGIRIVEVEQ